jgi:hypothetical protein
MFEQVGVRYGYWRMRRSKPAMLTFKVKWEQPCEDRRTTPLGNNTSMVTQGCTRKTDNNITYSTKSSHKILRLEGLKETLHLVKDAYEKDPIGPTTLSLLQALPIKKVIAIYGINLPTEVSVVYKRNPSLQIQKSPHNHKVLVKQLFVLDKNAKLTNGKGNGAVVINGTIWETRKTSQKLLEVESSKSAGMVPSLTGVFSIANPSRGSAT